MAKIHDIDITDFFNELALLLENNLTLNEALKTIQTYQTNATFSRLIADIQQTTAKQSFADGLAKYPNYFQSFIVDLLRTSQATEPSSLTTVVRSIADYYDTMEDKNLSLHFKLLSSLSYFVVVFIIFLILTTTILLYVVPVMVDMFKDFGGELPMFTYFFIQLSDTVVNYSWLVISSVVILTALSWWYRASLLSSFPLFAGLYRKLALIHFLRTYAFVKSNGLSTKKALAAAIQVIHYSGYRKSLQRLHEKLNENTSLTTLLTTQPTILPAKVTHMLIVGEQSNQVALLLNKLADRYTKQLDQAIEPRAKIVGIILVFLLGIMIGSFVIAMYLPIFFMGSVI